MRFSGGSSDSDRLAGVDDLAGTEKDVLHDAGRRRDDVLAPMRMSIRFELRARLLHGRLRGVDLLRPSRHAGRLHLTPRLLDARLVATQGHFGAVERRLGDVALCEKFALPVIISVREFERRFGALQTPPAEPRSARAGSSPRADFASCASIWPMRADASAR